MFQTLKLIPSKVWIIDGEVLGVLGCSLAGLFWLLLPFFECGKPARTRRGSPAFHLCSCLRDWYECLWLCCEISSSVRCRPLSRLAGFLVLASCLAFGQAVNSCLDCHSAQPAAWK